MNKAGILELIARCGLPGKVKACLAGAASRTESSSIKKTLRKDPAGLLSGIEELLNSAAGVLGLPAETVLFVTGFNANNLAPGRFEAALAELRAAVFLASQGFEKLELVEQSGSRTADLAGTRSGHRYVFEVCRLRDDGVPAGVKRLSSKYAKKISQVKVTRKKYGCALGGLVLLDGPLGFGPLLPDPALLLPAAGVCAGRDGRAEHLCLIRGDGYAVWPDWRR